MLLYHFKRQKLGFTLVELLVVIAIIGIISTAAVVNLNHFKAKARDARRLSDITQIRKALEIYNYTTGDDYPAEDGRCSGLLSISGCISADYNHPIDNQWLPGLDAMPRDPINAVVNQNEPNQVIYLYLYQKIIGSPKNYYLLQFNLETQPRIDECDGEGYTSLSCVSVPK
ncbi:MAG: type II secretion system protein [Patescibacteria group bacterium]|jgi:general secretion pathway protein G